MRAGVAVDPAQARRRAGRRARVRPAGARAVAGPVAAAGHRALVRALRQRIGAARNVDALTFAARDRARLAGSRARGLAADALRAERRRAVAAGRARRARRLRTAASVHARRARHAIGGGRAASIDTSRRCRTGTGRTNRWSSRRTSPSPSHSAACVTVDAAQVCALADRPARVHRARAGAVAEAVAHAAGDAVIGTFVARVGAHGNVHARADAARLRARLAQPRAVRSAADVVEAEAALAVVGGRARGADLRARSSLRPRRRSSPRAAAAAGRPRSAAAADRHVDRRIDGRRRRPAAASRRRRRNRRRATPATKADGTSAWTCRKWVSAARPEGPRFTAETARYFSGREQLFGDVGEAPGPQLTRPDAEVVRGDAHQLGVDVRRHRLSARDLVDDRVDADLAPQVRRLREQHRRQARLDVGELGRQRVDGNDFHRLAPATAVLLQLVQQRLRVQRPAADHRPAVDVRDARRRSG